MGFTEIMPFVTEKEREYFLSFLHDDDWYKHKSTVSGRESPLQFKAVKFREIDAYLMKMDPNTTQDWHTDSLKNNRATLILHPLTENYAPFQSLEGATSKPIIADVQSKHAVFNNNNIRMNLQIPFNIPYRDIHSDKNSVVWKLLNRFYKENDDYGQH